MSIYVLCSDIWEIIVCFLDGLDNINLISTGDRTLTARVKPVIRDFKFTLPPSKVIPLSSLLSIVKRHSNKVGILSIGKDEGLQFQPEALTAEKWEEVFPQTLETLQLSVWTKVSPFTHLLGSLSIVAPKLKVLHLTVIPRNLTLPSSLTKLEIGYFSGEIKHMLVKVSLKISLKILPTTLTHLKFSPQHFLNSNLSVKELPFKKMPLKVFHANINFSSIDYDEALWSILPNTIEDLRAQLTYSRYEDFDAPKPNLSWAALFPNLSRLEISGHNLIDDLLIAGFGISSGKPLNATEIEILSNYYPKTLTNLIIYQEGGFEVTPHIDAIITAIGHRLRLFSTYDDELPNDFLALIPHWQNPHTELVSTESQHFERLSERETRENFLNKNHPISLLNRNVTRLKTSYLPATAIPLLPKNIKSITFALCGSETISSPHRSEMSSYPNVNIQEDVSYSSSWELLQWSPHLTKLEIIGGKLPPGTSFSFKCLPPTLTKLQISCRGLMEVTESDLSHIEGLFSFSFSGCAPILTRMQDLPRSLRKIDVDGAPIAREVFETEGAENFFYNLRTLILNRVGLHVDGILRLPKTLTRLSVDPDDGVWTEEHFKVFSEMKLSELDLYSYATWGESIPLDVFARYLPSTLAHLTLELTDLNAKKNAYDIAQFIPTGLNTFYSCSNPVLNAAVKCIIASHRIQDESDEEEEEEMEEDEEADEDGDEMEEDDDADVVYMDEDLDEEEEDEEE